MMCQQRIYQKTNDNKNRGFDNTINNNDDGSTKDQDPDRPLAPHWSPPQSPVGLPSCWASDVLISLSFGLQKVELHVV